MKEIHFTDTNFVDDLVATFLSNFPIALFEFSGIYGLIAVNSIMGCKALNHTKNRLPNKFYGSFPGDDLNLTSVMKDQPKGNLSHFLTHAEGAILRFPVRGKNIPNEVICNGAHQFLVETEEVRLKIKNLEEKLLKTFPVSDFFEHNYQAPLCTSANESGDANGGILQLKDALDFGKKKNIPLFIHTGLRKELSGSYPVISVEKESVELVRSGPRGEEILEKLQRNLR